MGKTIKTIEDLFEIAEGTINIAVKLGLHQLTVDKWPETGIPQKHWEFLINEYGVSADALHKINTDIRKSNA